MRRSGNEGGWMNGRRWRVTDGAEQALGLRLITLLTSTERSNQQGYGTAQAGVQAEAATRVRGVAELLMDLSEA